MRKHFAVVAAALALLLFTAPVVEAAPVKKKPGIQTLVRQHAAQIRKLRRDIADLQKRQPVVSVVQASKHAWPDLSQAETIALGEALVGFQGVKVHIVCNDGACTDLAHDLDNAFEIAGADSALDKSVFPLGYGIGVGGDADDKRVDMVVAALGKVTSNRIKPKIERGDYAGVIVIAIGKKPK